MCGIAGILSQQPIDGTILRRMLAAMVHRGPDDEGTAHFQPSTSNLQPSTFDLHFGMRRLAIIDLSGGRQPMFNEDRTLAIVFNGEIYNFLDLRAALEAKGHRFRTRSDTEVILHAYEEWGQECVHRLRGMFALAIYDGRPETIDRSLGPRPQAPTLFLARDRLGIKPLYYYAADGLFLFASEVRALLTSGVVPFRLNLDALYSYLLLGSVQEPLTLIEGVYSLLPGHWMAIKVEARSQKPEVIQRRYWDFPVPEQALAPAKGDVLKQVRDLLEKAVKIRLIAEVPLGAFLSGGIDSAAVVGLMRQVGERAPRTFTVVFREREYNEGEVARVTARRFHTEHAEVVVTGEQVLAELPQALAAMDQPTMDGINTYYVSRAAREAGLTVALSGLGGDEIFAGYSTFHTVPRLHALHRHLHRLPRPLRRSLSHLLPNLQSRISNLLSPISILQLPSSFSPSARHKLAAFINGDMPFGHTYFLARALFTPAQARSLLTPQARERLREDTPWHDRVRATLEKARGYDPINAVSYLEATHYLLSTLLRDTDQMSMAHSLEVRVPLIDHELVEFMFTLPGSWKTHPPLSPLIPHQPRATSHEPRATNHEPSATSHEPRANKPLLVAALNGALPPEVIHRRKTTFTFPWERWLRGPLREEVGATLRRPPEALQGIVDARAVRQVWDAFLAGRTTWSRPWALYVLFRWVER